MLFAGERDTGGGFLPDEAGAAGEDNFHGFDEGRKIDVR